MTAISDFTTKLNAFFDRQDTALSDLQADVKNLSDQIAALQNSSGAITPEDQALLDGIQARASAVSDKLEALDALTPPTVSDGSGAPEAGTAAHNVAARKGGSSVMTGSDAQGVQKNVGPQGETGKKGPTAQL